MEHQTRQSNHHDHVSSRLLIKDPPLRPRPHEQCRWKAPRIRFVIAIILWCKLLLANELNHVLKKLENKSKVLLTLTYSVAEWLRRWV